MDAGIIGSAGKVFFGEGGLIAHVAADPATGEVMPFASKLGELFAARDARVANPLPFSSMIGARMAAAREGAATIEISDRLIQRLGPLPTTTPHGHYLG